jgi:hypothetical protein
MRKISIRYVSRNGGHFETLHLQKFHTIIEFARKTQNFEKYIVLICVFLIVADVSNMRRFLLLNSLGEEPLLSNLELFFRSGPTL